jgi:lipopolysaccharide export LptBFGC system permease protein LptF
MKSNYYLIVVIACMINISPIFGQSRAKKKEIIADSKTAKRNSLKQIHLWKYFEKAYGYVIFLTWVRVGLS